MNLLFFVMQLFDLLVQFLKLALAQGFGRFDLSAIFLDPSLHIVHISRYA